MALTRAAKIESIEEQIAKLEQQRKALIQAQKEQESKDRTRRLIQRGAILESLIPNAVALTNDQIKAFLEKIITGDYAKRQLASIAAQSAFPQVKPQGSKASQAAEATAKKTDTSAKQSSDTLAPNVVKTEK
jgi:hypothetical protein